MMAKDEDYEQAKKNLEKYFKENPGAKGMAGNIDLDEMLKQYAASKMMSGFGNQNRSTDFDRIISAIEKTKNTGMDPMMLMIMFMTMGQNNHQQMPPYPYGQYPVAPEPKEDMLDKMMRYKLMSEIFSGKKGSDTDDFLKLYTALNGGKGDSVDKFIEYMKQKEMDQRDERTGKSIDALKDEMRRSLTAIQNPQNTSDPLYIIKQYQALKGALDQIYQYATPEQQREFPKQGEEWTADDVVTLAQKIIGTVPTLATAVGAVRGDRRARPPKKEMPENERPMPTDHARGDLPSDIEAYFKSWKGPPNTALTDPNGTRFENPEAKGSYYTKAEMLEYAKADPDGMRQLIDASNRKKRNDEMLQREQAKKEQRQQPETRPLPPPPAPPQQEPKEEPDEWKETNNESEEAEQGTQPVQEQSQDPDSVEQQEYTEPSEDVVNDGDQEQ